MALYALHIRYLGAKACGGDEMLLDFDRLGLLRCVLCWASPAWSRAFLLLPIVFIVLLSFGSSRWLVFPPPGWTLRWYRGAVRPIRAG